METVLRVVIIYVLLLVGLRIIGKRELGELSPFDFVTLILIPEIVSQSLLREDYSLTNAFIGISTLMCLLVANSTLSYLSEPFRRATEGDPVVLVHNGRLIQRNMDRQRVAADEIMAEARKAGVEDLSMIRWAILETDGRIGIVSTTPGGARGPTERTMNG